MQNFLGEVTVFLNAACFSQNFPKRVKKILDQRIVMIFFNGPVIIGTVIYFMQLDLLKSGVIFKMYN